MPKENESDDFRREMEADDQSARKDSRIIRTPLNLLTSRGGGGGGVA